MAFVDYYDTSSGGKQKVYNVSFAVGAGKPPNRRDDVLLVQYMLKRVYQKPIYKKLILTKQQGEMSVDGLCGPITVRWIKHFQSDVKKADGNILVDGRVDRALAGVSSISGTEYTIHFLCDAFRSHYEEIYENMSTHPDVPPEVRAALWLNPSTL